MRTGAHGAYECVRCVRVRTGAYGAHGCVPYECGRCCARDPQCTVRDSQLTSRSVLSVPAHSNPHMRFVLAFLLSALVAPAASAQKPQVPRPDLSGAWTFNREASSTPRGGGPDMPAPGGGGGGMRGGFGGLGGGLGEPGRGVPDREEMARRRALLKEVFEAPTRFQITLEDPMVIFTHPDGRVVRYKADWKEERHQYTSGTVKTKTKWEAGRLVIETDLGSGVKVTRGYKTTGDPRQLVVSVELPGQSRDLPPITQVYDEQPL